MEGLAAIAKLNKWIDHGVRLRGGKVSFQRKNPDFPFKNPGFLIRNPGFLLKNVDFIISKQDPLGFVFLYELMTATLSVKIRATDSPHSLAMMLMRLMPGKETQKSE